MTVDEDAERLYRLPPEEFTAARDEAAKVAKKAGDVEAATALKALRKPSVSAHLVNLLVVDQEDLVEQLLALGPELARAQAQGQGEELRALGAQRRELVDAVTRQAVELAGRPVTAAVREEVAATLEAALADAGAADAVRSGRLVRALSYAGFGGVDLEGAVATRTPASAGRKAPARKKAPAAEPDQERAERIAAAEAAALEAAGRLDDVVRACERAEQERKAAESASEGAHAEVERVRQALQEAEQEAREADHQRISAQRASEKAIDRVRRAQHAEEQARAELDRLRRGS